jgi:hypothetical protein
MAMALAPTAEATRFTDQQRPLRGGVKVVNLGEELDALDLGHPLCCQHQRHRSILGSEADQRPYGRSGRYLAQHFVVLSVALGQLAFQDAEAAGIVVEPEDHRCLSQRRRVHSRTPSGGAAKAGSLRPGGGGGRGVRTGTGSHPWATSSASSCGDVAG